MIVLLIILFFREISETMNQLLLGEHIQCITQGYIDDINLSGVVECALSGILNNNFITQ